MLDSPPRHRPAQQWEVSRNLGLRLSAQGDFSQLAAAQKQFMLELKGYHYRAAGDATEAARDCSPQSCESDES